MKRRIRMAREAMALKLFGPRYTGNHDYKSLRLRYACHHGVYGWSRKWRFGERVVSFAKNKHYRFLPYRFRISRRSAECSPYWRELFDGRRFIRGFAA